jgi:RNAse (barnase) inhibitor barstar
MPMRDDQIIDELTALFNDFRSRAAEKGYYCEDVNALTDILQEQILRLVEKPIAAYHVLKELGVEI